MVRFVKVYPDAERSEVEGSLVARNEKGRQSTAFRGTTRDPSLRSG
jgi:hypothetical protein